MLLSKSIAKCCGSRNIPGFPIPETPNSSSNDSFVEYESCVNDIPNSSTENSITRGITLCITKFFQNTHKINHVRFFYDFSQKSAKTFRNYQIYVLSKWLIYLTREYVTSK